MWLFFKLTLGFLSTPINRKIISIHKKKSIYLKNCEMFSNMWKFFFFFFYKFEGKYLNRLPPSRKGQFCYLLRFSAEQNPLKPGEGGGKKNGERKKKKKDCWTPEVKHQWSGLKMVSADKLLLFTHKWPLEQRKHIFPEHHLPHPPTSVTTKLRGKSIILWKKVETFMTITMAEGSSESMKVDSRNILSGGRGLQWQSIQQGNFKCKKKAVMRNFHAPSIFFFFFLVVSIEHRANWA